MKRGIREKIIGKLLFLTNGAMLGIILGLLVQNCGQRQWSVNASGLVEKTEAVTGTSASANVINQSEKEEENICYLTFDDGPSSNTVKILDILKKYEAKATFFVIGNSLTEENREIVERMIKEGHCIGLHANDHNYSKFYESENSWQQDLELLENRLEKEYGIKTRLFRFPGGSACHYMKGNVKEHIAAMHEKGMVCFDWNVSGEDSVGSPTTALIYQNVLQGALKYHTPVVLLHDSSIADATVEALKDILRELSSRGYRFETLENRKEYIFRSSRE